MDPIYPDIEVELVGQDGNAFNLMGIKALRRNKVADAEVKKFQDECMSGDYDHLLQTCMKWVSVS